MKIVAASTALLAAGLVVGCTEALGAGASAVFVNSVMCPASRVKVNSRPDIRPHEVYVIGAPPAAPPPEIAGDPERLKLWESHQPQLDIDAIARTYEVHGCGHTVIYVCAHPRIDGGDGPFSVDAYLDIDHHTALSFHTENRAELKNNEVIYGDTVTSAVVCMPANAR